MPGHEDARVGRHLVHRSDLSAAGFQGRGDRYNPRVEPGSPCDGRRARSRGAGPRGRLHHGRLCPGSRGRRRQLRAPRRRDAGRRRRVGLGQDDAGALAARPAARGRARASAARCGFAAASSSGSPRAGSRRCAGPRSRFVFQEPGLALHPVLRVGEQIAEVMRAHRSWRRAALRAEAERLIARVGLPSPARLYARVSARAERRPDAARDDRAGRRCRPALLVADEPTSALDSTTRAEILALLGS